MNLIRLEKYSESLKFNDKIRTSKINKKACLVIGVDVVETDVDVEDDTVVPVVFAVVAFVVETVVG